MFIFLGKIEENVFSQGRWARRAGLFVWKEIVCMDKSVFGEGLVAVCVKHVISSN